MSLSFFLILPGTLLIFLGAAHQRLREEKKAKKIKIIKRGK
jgi:hypothetical protein